MRIRRTSWAVGCATDDTCYRLCCQQRSAAKKGRKPARGPFLFYCCRFRSFDSLLRLLLTPGEGLRDVTYVSSRAVRLHQQMTGYASVTRETISRVPRSLEKSEVGSVLDGKAILLNKNFFEAKRKRLLSNTRILPMGGRSLTSSCTFYCFRLAPSPLPASLAPHYFPYCNRCHCPCRCRVG